MWVRLCCASDCIHNEDNKKCTHDGTSLYKGQCVSYKSRYKSEEERALAVMKRFAETPRTPGESREFLISAGILNPDGTLSKKYNPNLED